MVKQKHELTEGFSEYQNEYSNQFEEKKISWKENEFFKQDKKSVYWYSLLGIGTLILSTVVFLLTDSILSTLVIIIVAVTIVVMNNKHPKEVNYNIHNDGIEINGKLYQFNSFRSFTIIPERNGNNLQFFPVKRFMIPVTIFISDDQLDEIIELLSEVLPFEEQKSNYADKLTKKLKF